LEHLTFAGSAELEGARLRYHGAKLGLSGGALTLSARGEGALGDVTQWLRSGSLRVTGVDALLSGQASRRVDLASATFTRDGERFRIADARIVAGGLTATGSGEW